MLLPVSLLFSVAVSTSAYNDFPPYFKFGASSSAYQVEGAWNEDGKTASIWDNFVHKIPSPIAENATGDVAADSYHLWKEDVRIASELGLNFYRFSISWPRLLPNGFSNEINEAGVEYYNNLINGLLEAGIEPVVTLYHWDLPTILQELGGWANPLIADWFADYSRVVFSLFADRVKTWITINEPIVICEVTYGLGVAPPSVVEDKFSPYICNKNVLLAHAKAYRVYDREFRRLYGGRLSISNHIVWYEPLTPADESLAELTRQNAAGRYAHAIFSRQGGWPPEIEQLLLEISIREGYRYSRLPRFTQAEKKLIRGTADFFGLNYYTARKVRYAQPGEDIGPWFTNGYKDANAVLEIPSDAVLSASSALAIYPKGIRSLLCWIQKSYGNVPIWITENGFPGSELELNDFNRIKYIKDHLEQVSLAMNVDGVNVIGYTFWSLTDNMEWNDGYRTKFGLYQIDFNDPERNRVARLSAQFYKCVIIHHSVDVPETCFKSDTRVKRQASFLSLPKLPSISNDIKAMKAIFENRECIIKVFLLLLKLMVLMNANQN
ncbi:myrosinase 1-like [Leptidea sinapis]|uniref:myrosinase 1-like n=1 Tax=Leptidea sinapis TaxID=189913 RepID=UPI00212EA90D|nr:myrosinase 1-like [Leptidea sinapis]